MKKLKFMLAAATAIGLASALHAEEFFLGSNDFEGFGLNSVITSTTNSNYFTTPQSAEEGDYQIVAGTPNSEIRTQNLPPSFSSDRAKVLQLEGGTDPFLCHAKSGAAAVDLTAAPVYVDTLVQFTVTPAGDTVTAQTGDKLMVYLQQVTNGVGEVTGTNLVAKGGYFADGASDVVAKDYILNAGKAIEAGTWYRLTVCALPNLADPAEAVFAGFTISIDGTVCTLNDYAVAQADDPGDEENGLVYPFSTLAFDSEAYTLLSGKKAVLSLVKNDSTLKSVGFAGSGFVDDLVFTTLDPEVTFLTFTLAWNANGTEAFDAGVNYTCGGKSGEVDAAGTTVYYGPGTNVVVTYAYDATAYTYAWSDGTTAAGNDTITPVAGATVTLSATENQTSVDYTFTFTGEHVNGVIYTVGEEATVFTNMGKTVAANSTLHVTGFVFAPWYVIATDSAVKAGSTLTVDEDNKAFAVTADATTDGTVPAGTTLADVGIDSSTGLVDADLPKVAAWAHTYGGGDTAASLALVNTMSFDANGVPQNEASEAYLLNCAVANLATAKADFKFTSFDPTDPPEAADFDGKGYNGTVTIQGKETLSAANWTDLPIVGIYPKFFRAILTKPVPTP